MQLIEYIISALVGSVITGLVAILGIWYKDYLDHKPLQKQTIFPTPFTCPSQSNDSDDMISTLNAQCVEFDFSKGDRSRKWVSIVYEFNQLGLLSNNDFFDFEVVFEEGNYRQIDLELKIPKNNDGYETIDIIRIKTSSNNNRSKPIPVKVSLNDYDKHKVHNMKQLCFVIRKNYILNEDEHCHGKFRIQNLSVV